MNKDFLNEKVDCFEFYITHENLRDYFVEWHGVEESKVTEEVIYDVTSLLDKHQDWISEQFNVCIQESIEEVFNKHFKGEGK